MTRTQIVGRLRGVMLLACAAGLLLPACGDDPPTSPNTPRPPASGQPPAATPSITRIEIEAPQIAPGQTVQLVVRVYMSDGSVTTATDGVSWINPFSNVVQISASGLATGRAPGEADIFASFRSHTARATVLVLPEHTFRLTGVVRDFGFGIPGVTVEVIEGTGTGLTARTLHDGSYRLYGVAGEIRLHIKKDGYTNGFATVTVNSNGSHDLSVAAEGARREYTGDYILTIRTSPECTNIPSDVRERRYGATLRQDGGRVIVSLRGGDFILNDGHGNAFSGYLDGARNFRFPISDVVLDSDFYYYYAYTGDFDIAERVGHRSFLVHGTASASDLGGRITGMLDGWLRTTLRAQPLFLPFERTCYSTRHAFDLTPGSE